MQNIELYKRELVLVHEEIPNFAQVIINAIENGNIDGKSYLNHNGVACFYGHLFEDDNDAHMFSYRIDQLVWKDEQGLTPIEELIWDIKPGQTHLTHPETLGLLRELCLEYVKQGEK